MNEVSQPKFQVRGKISAKSLRWNSAYPRNFRNVSDGGAVCRLGWGKWRVVGDKTGSCRDL